MPVSLPRELLEQIIDDETLNQRTLASCCRLSKSWVAFARRRLYRHVTFQIVEDTIMSLNGLFGGDPRAFTDDSADLFATLRQHPALRQLVRELSIEELSEVMSHHMPSGMSTTLRTAVPAILYTCSNLKRLNMPDNEDAVDIVDSAYGPSMEEGWRMPSVLSSPRFSPKVYRLLETAQDEIDTLIVESEAKYHEDSVDADVPELPRLRLTTLRCDGWSLVKVDEPAELLEALVDSSRKILLSLSLPLDTNYITDFSSFSSLRHLDLELEASSGIQLIKDALLSLPPSLSSLAFRNVVSVEYDDLRPLVTALPPSLRQLRLSQTSLCHALAVVYNLPASSGLRFLRCDSEVNERRWDGDWDLPVGRPCHA